jgi:hypothetical protein
MSLIWDERMGVVDMLCWDESPFAAYIHR